MDGCDSFQEGPPFRVNSSCFSKSRVVQMGAGCGARRHGTIGGGGNSSSDESSFCFPVNGV